MHLMNRASFDRGIELLSQEYGKQKYYDDKVSIIWNMVKHEDEFCFIAACEYIISNIKFNPTPHEIIDIVRIESSKKAQLSNASELHTKIAGCKAYSCESTGGIIHCYDHNGYKFAFKCPCRKGQSRREKMPTFKMDTMWDKYVLHEDDVDLLAAFVSVKSEEMQSMQIRPQDLFYKNTQFNNYEEATKKE